MPDLNVTVRELALVALTRGLAGVGIGLLASEHLTQSQRRTLGWGLFALGALSTSTIPLGMRILPRATGPHMGDQLTFARASYEAATAIRPTDA